MPYRSSSKHECFGQACPSSSNQTLPPLWRTKKTQAPHLGHVVGRQKSSSRCCQLKQPSGCVATPPGERPRCPSPPHPHVHPAGWFQALHIMHSACRRTGIRLTGVRKPLGPAQPYGGPAQRYGTGPFCCLIVIRRAAWGKRKPAAQPFLRSFLPLVRRALYAPPHQPLRAVRRAEPGPTELSPTRLRYRPQQIAERRFGPSIDQGLGQQPDSSGRLPSANICLRCRAGLSSHPREISPCAA